ncbi:MAG: class I SAM-dependent rRNA methyltransferase, partial [Planctomycetes bacterium]|nr:class I SAM-dependent rRNA methyltransferase [Planctomycetota bacterium]
REGRRGAPPPSRRAEVPPTLRLRPAAELPEVELRQDLRNPHPWIWRSNIARDPGGLATGDLVRVSSPGGPIGVALYHPGVTIGLRLLTRDADESIDAAFFVRRLRAAQELRAAFHLEETTNAYRLLHAEADEVSGLVIDVLGDVIRVECYALGIARLREPIAAALHELFPDKQLVIRANHRASEIEGFTLEPAAEEPHTTEVREHGVRYHVDLRTGHKTGFFCDQRENRLALGQLAAGKTVLDVNTYTGGFALTALAQGASSVTGVDLDEEAIAVATKNAKLNQAGGKARFVQADAFPYLRQLTTEPEVMVLDPPKLVQDPRHLEEGLRTYSDLNRLGMEKIQPGGTLVTCSCSGAVSEAAFLDMLRNAAGRAQRTLTIFRVAGPGPDHPVALHVPETRYLKAVFARVNAL